MSLKKFDYYLVSLHREENIESENNFRKLIKILNIICKKYNKKVIFSTHPRTEKRIKETQIKLDPLIKLLKPLSFSNYNNLQINAKAVLSDSGTISEESSILNFPSLNLRENHERPEAMEEASVIMTGLEEDKVIQGLEIIHKQKEVKIREHNLVKDYSVKNVSSKIVRLIISYTDYVNNYVWRDIN